MADYKNSIGCIFNYGAHYRQAVYSLMGQRLGCHFYFGDGLDIKKIDYDALPGFKGELKRKNIAGHWYYLRKGVSKALKYRTLIITGEVYCFTFWIILLLGRLTGRKIYVWTHGWYGRETFIRKQIKKNFYRLADGVLLYGEYARDLMLREGFRSDKLHVIYNSLDYDRQLETRAALKPFAFYREHFGNDDETLIFIGRLIVSKKIAMLLEAVRLLKDRGLNYNLVIVGSGEEETVLQEKARALGIEAKVWFYGACYEEEKIGELLYHAAICVSPGEVGLTAIHSLTFGTPVITHDYFPGQGPEFEAIQEGVTGLFFRKGEVQDLARAIQEWSGQHTTGREKIRQEAYQMIEEKFNPHRQLSLLISLMGEKEA